jgi:hypothetical protein
MKVLLSLLALSILMVSCQPKEDPPVDLDNMAMSDEGLNREVKN